jgi:hypothetical protein
VRKAALIAAAGLSCGFLWEFWNFWANPKWVYDIAYLEVLHVFEMPLAEYLGYVPFAWSVSQLMQVRPVVDVLSRLEHGGVCAKRVSESIDRSGVGVLGSCVSL